MKQNITEKQWNELSNEEKELFISSFNGEYRMDQIERSIFGTRIDFLPNIGQMIEFLEDAEILKLGVLWWVKLWEEPKNINEVLRTGEITMKAPFESKELCDALWEAVKNKLKENKTPTN